jgi:hypothetical protein
MGARAKSLAGIAAIYRALSTEQSAGNGWLNGAGCAKKVEESA